MKLPYNLYIMIFKYNLNNQDISLEKLESHSALVIEQTNNEIIEFSKKIKKTTPSFPIIAITDNFEDYPHLNPFHCISQKDFNIKILESLVFKNEEKINQCLKTIATPVNSVSDQVLFSEAVSFLKSIVINYQAPKINKNPILDTLSSMGDKISEIQSKIKK